MVDEMLVKAARKGDEEAFYRLITAQKEQLYNIAYCYLKNEQDALEAIQETVCRAYVKLDKLQEPKYFGSWLIRILINYCIDEQKRRKRKVPLEDSVAHCDSTALESLIVEEAVEKLGDKYKQVIVLKYFQDMSISDIAKVMERPEGTIKTWIFRALERLRDLLGKESDCGV